MDAIPLGPRANLDHYRKLAKELRDAWKAPDEDAVRVWAKQWLERLAMLDGAPVALFRTIDDAAKRVATLVHESPKPQVLLADAQHLLARLHGFESWPRFAKHLEALQRTSTGDWQFEAAADAVVTGDVGRLRALLANNPALIRARSSRRHRATLLHYAAANGIETFRQRTPANIVEVARLLLDAGAEVDAVNGHYGDGTALGLVATSAHPRRAGLQLALLELLVAAGARLNGAANGWQPMSAALANGCPEAAEWLAAHGAPLDVVTAAGVGRLDVLERGLAEEGVTRAQLERAFLYACACGRTAAAKVLLDRGVDIGARDGQTGLHLATDAAHLETVRFLLSRQAPLEVRNQYGGTVLGQAIWSAAHNREVDYLPVVEALLSAGAVVGPGWSTGIEAIDGLLRNAIAKRG
jgi:ankyrin repeat protein